MAARARGGRSAAGSTSASGKRPRAKTRKRTARTAPRAAARAAPAAAGEGNEDKQTVTLTAAGPIPRMRIEVTQLQLGEYSVSLWDRNGMNPTEVARSTNDDDVEDEFSLVRTLAQLAGLDRFTLFWVVWIKALKFGPGARFFVSVTLTQGEVQVARFEREGAMTKKFLPFNGEWSIRVA